MASFFGEVIGLSSRAVEDYDNANKSTPEFQVDVSETANYRHDFVIFAVGKLAVTFVASHFRASDAETTMRIKMVFPKKDVEDMGVNYEKPPKVVAQAYVNPSRPSSLICDVDDNVPEDLNPYLFEALSRYCNREVESIVLMSTHSSSYKTNAARPEESFLKCLSTSNFRTKYPSVNVPYLTPPNVVTKFPATVLTEAEIRKQAALLVICYTDIPSVDSGTVELFKEVLNIPIVRKKLLLNSDADSRLLSYLRSHSHPEDNLYI